VRRLSSGPVVAASVAGALVAGAVLRVWIIASPLGAVDSDEAVWGLMAKRVLDGELSTFFWAQSYGGTQEALVTAAVFAVAGAGTLALKLVPVALFAVAAVLVWRIGLRTVGAPAAAVAAALFWIWPAYVVWKSTKAHGFYGAALALGLGSVLLALRLRDRDSTLDAALLGLALGLGWWATPQFVFLALPVLVWLVIRRPAVLRRAPVALATAILGALPWLVWNLRHDWYSFKPGPEPGPDTYVDHLQSFAAATFPTLLGLRVPFSLDWIATEPVGRAATVAVVAWLVWLALRRRERLEPLLAIAAAYPFLQAISPFAALNTEPRYLVLLAPVLALLLSPLAARAAPVALAAALALTLAGLAPMARDDLAAPLTATGEPVPADLDPALAVLRREGVDRVRADYWIAYRITWESDEEIVADSTGVTRDERAEELVDVADRVAGVGVEAGEWIVVVPR
jgi:hypothetical protein